MGVALVVVSTTGPEVTRAWIVQAAEILSPRSWLPHARSNSGNDYHVFATPAFCFMNEHSMIEAAGLIGPNMEAWKTQIGSLAGPQITIPEGGLAEVERE